MTETHKQKWNDGIQGKKSSNECESLMYLSGPVCARFSQDYLILT